MRNEGGVENFWEFLDWEIGEKFLPGIFEFCPWSENFGMATFGDVDSILKGFFQPQKFRKFR